MRSRRTILRRIRASLGGGIGSMLKAGARLASHGSDGASLAVADACAILFYYVAARARRTGHQNLRAVFGDSLGARERRRILLGSCRNAMRSVWALLHLRPLDEKRYRRWVRIDPEFDAWLRTASVEIRSGVLLGAHFGNWELLAALQSAVPGAPPLVYMVETTPLPEVDAAIQHLRDRGSVTPVLRKGGALALKAALERGDCVGIAIDRNIRGEHGGVYVPFLGLPARTSPLPVMLARRFGVPLGVFLCIPEGDRWRLWKSPDLMEPPTDDEDADTRKILGKVNDTISQAIREHPEAWLWMIKRWKSRPTAELGRYPPYSFHDP